MGVRSRRPFSAAVEDYLKAIYKLQRDEDVVLTTRLARKMRTTPAAASKMARHLAELKLIEHTPYRGLRLTPAGERIALETIRHHRLLELYLCQALGYGWDEVNEEAERLEHHISEAFEERIDHLLNHPSLDPHGSPIPTRDGEVDVPRGRPLAEFGPGETLVVLRVRDSDPEVLRGLSEMGVRLDAVLHVTEKVPRSGSVTLRLGDRTLVFGRDLAGSVFGEPVGVEEGTGEEPQGPLAAAARAAESPGRPGEGD